MPAEETIFSSEVKYGGVFSFADLYNFCYDWLKDRVGLDISEKLYEEKIKGDSKDVYIAWDCQKEINDYFMMKVKVRFRIIGLKKVQVSQSDGSTLSTNEGSLTMSIQGIIVRDHQGKFEMSGFHKFLRGIYEKWIIDSLILNIQESIVYECNEFVLQTKAYLGLEGK